MAWTVDYYRTERGEQPVKMFIDSLPVKLRAKNMREISMLEEFGTNMPAPYVKQMHGKDSAGLWELRVKLSSDITRIFYFYPEGNRILLLHGFLKKTENTPPAELKIAQSRMKDAKKRGL